MSDYIWRDSEKCPCANHREIKIANRGFAYATFDVVSETLYAVDFEGFLHVVELSQDDFPHRKLDNVGKCTFVAFDPLNQNLLLGLENNEIRIYEENKFSKSCVLVGHTSPAKCASFYKIHGLTVSEKEVIIWYLQSYSKAHHLQLGSQNLIVRKALFSSLGHISVLFKSDTMQIWLFPRFDTDVKLNLSNFDLYHVKDFTFTMDGKATIIGGSNGRIIVFDTLNWNPIKSLVISAISPGITQILAISRTLDGGANKAVALLLSDSTTKFFDLQNEKLIPGCDCRETSLTKRISVSRNGRFLLNLKKNGTLLLTWLEKSLKEKVAQEKASFRETSLEGHRAADHLECVQKMISMELRVDRLLKILGEFGEYPEKHRMKIWASLMKLPSNRKAYNQLSSQDPQESMVELFEKCSLADKGRENLLKTLIGCLVKWTPFLEDSLFLPKLVFPFLLVFQKNPMHAFETVLTIIMNFCKKWWEYHPLPPLNVLGIIENVLLEADPGLLKVFAERGITSSEYAWPLLQTCLSEVLLSNDWLVLWDHLISDGKPSLLFFCVVAYSICCRTVIISTLKTNEDFHSFFSSQGQVSAKRLLKVAYHLDRKIPARRHPSSYIQDDMETLPKSDIYSPFPQKEYPKIMNKNEQVRNLKRLKELEKISLDEQYRVMKLMEEQRLKTETEKFIKKIEEERMEELQKCHEHRIRQQISELRHIHGNSIWDASEEAKSLYSVSERRLENFETEDKNYGPKTKSQRRSRREIRKNVDDLEIDVYNLLKRARSKDDATKRTDTLSSI